MHKTIILAAFDSLSGKSLIDTLYAEQAYEITAVETLNAMFQALGLSSRDEPTVSPTNSLDWCLMDADLGIKRRGACIPAIKVYNHLRKDIEGSRIYFMTFTENKITKRKADEQNIPVIRYLEATKLMNLHERIRDNNKFF